MSCRRISLVPMFLGADVSCTAAWNAMISKHRKTQVGVRVHAFCNTHNRVQKLESFGLPRVRHPLQFDPENSITRNLLNTVNQEFSEPMRRTFLNSKIHRATVTQADLDYEGSITIDPVLMQISKIAEFEQVDVLDITNGSRLTTYVIKGLEGSGEICINGAAAKLVNPGDRVIIVSYIELDKTEIEAHKPTVVHVNDSNEVVRVG